MTTINKTRSVHIFAQCVSNGAKRKSHLVVIIYEHIQVPFFDCLVIREGNNAEVKIYKKQCTWVNTFITPLM